MKIFDFLPLTIVPFTTSRVQVAERRLVGTAVQPGFSLIELLLVLVLVSMLFMFVSPFTTQWLQQKYAMTMLNDVKIAMEHAATEALVRGQTIRLTPCRGCSSWSEGLSITSAHPDNTLLYEWRWPKSAYRVTWNGFIANDYLQFSTDLRHAALNGYFTIVNAEQQGWKLVVNRLGYQRVEVINSARDDMRAVTHVQKNVNEAKMPIQLKTDQPKPPKLLLSWLTHTQSLTEKLHARAHHTALQVLQEQWLKHATPWDHAILQIAPDRVFHRDILMWALDMPCWFARTIIPAKTYTSDAPLFARLQHEPLGHLIFKGAAIRRVSLNYYSIDAQSPEYHWIPEVNRPSINGVLWVRISTFEVVHSGALFYLIEILLPGLERYYA